MVGRPLREPRSEAFGKLNNANLGNSGLLLHPNAATMSQPSSPLSKSGCRDRGPQEFVALSSEVLSVHYDQSQLSKWCPSAKRQSPPTQPLVSFWIRSRPIVAPPDAGSEGRRNVLGTIPRQMADVSASSTLLKTKKRWIALSLCLDAYPFGMNRF